jgi:hypothetical protein
MAVVPIMAVVLRRWGGMMAGAVVATRQGRRRPPPPLHAAERDAVLVEILVTDGCPYEDVAVDLVASAARGMGIAPRLVLVEVSDIDQAERQRFVGSPTIRVDGRDVAPPGAVPDLALVQAALERASTPTSSTDGWAS